MWQWEVREYESEAKIVNSRWHAIVYEHFWKVNHLIFNASSMINEVDEAQYPSFYATTIWILSNLRI